MPDAPARGVRLIRSLAALWLAACVTPVANAADLGARVDKLVESTMRDGRIPGMAVAVVTHGNTALAKGYGYANLEHDVPVTTETIFQSGSVGKQFTAAAVMMQVEAGKLALDAPVSRYLPDAPASWQGIRVRHLLTHTSGIPDYTDEHVDLRRDYSEDDLLHIAYQLPLDFAPGTHWRYSNTGSLVLGILVRKASGRFYGDVLHDRVFVPLGMKTARVISESDIVPHRAAGYRLENGEIKNQDWVAPQLNTTADGALYLSLSDMIAWNRGLQSGALLKPESWSAIYTPVTLNNGSRFPYGFGWEIAEVAGRPNYSHSGSWQGFRTFITRYLAGDTTVIVLANMAAIDDDDNRLEDLAHAVALVVDPRLIYDPPPEPEGARAAPPPASTVAANDASGSAAAPIAGATPAAVAAARSQVEAAERAFAATMAQRDFAAFGRFVADDAIFYAGERPLRGKSAITDTWSKFYQGLEAPFSWAPDHVEVLDSGVLALSSGPVKDPQGQVVARFNSIWRRDEDGGWRVVFDKGCDACPCASP
jgi:CubicO group peptidase (beta-lactamase class C family)/ketosteroid isomerase-like protein